MIEAAIDRRSRILDLAIDSNALLDGQYCEPVHFFRGRIAIIGQQRVGGRQRQVCGSVILVQFDGLPEQRNGGLEVVGFATMLERVDPPHIAVESPGVRRLFSDQFRTLGAHKICAYRSRQASLQRINIIEIAFYFARPNCHIVGSSGNKIGHPEFCPLELHSTGQDAFDLEFCCDFGWLEFIAHTRVLDRQFRYFRQVANQYSLDALHDVLLARVAAQVLDRQHGNRPNVGLRGRPVGQRNRHD